MKSFLQVMPCEIRPQAALKILNQFSKSYKQTEESDLGEWL